jgi:hypothetical protein
LGKFIQTHFVPALAVVRSETGTGETMKNRGKYRSESCYQTITTGLADLNCNRRSDRDQAGLDRLAGWPFSQTSCATHYPNFIPRFAINAPVKNRGRCRAKVVTISSQPAQWICEKTEAAFFVSI